MTMEEQAAPKRIHDIKAIYLTFVVFTFLQFDFVLSALSTVAITVALVLAYRARGRNAGNYLASHAHWLIRTFWIGGGVYLPIITLLGFYWIYTHMDIDAMQQQILSGAVDNPVAVMTQMETTSRTPALQAGIVLGIPFAVWWLWRCAHGYKYLQKGQAVPETAIKRWY